MAENGWDLSEDEEALEASEEVVNLCLMALGEETTSRKVSSTNEEILNEINVQDIETSYKNNFDKENELLETNDLKGEALRLKEENYKLIAQIKNQERILNNKIDALKNENENLEEVIQRFTKGNKMLDQMLHTKTSYNHEGLGYNKNSPPKGNTRRFVSLIKTSSESPSYKCSYCNKMGHTIQYCKFKNGEIKGKHAWIRKESYKKDDKRVPRKNMEYKNRRQQWSHQPAMFQTRNIQYHENGNAFRRQQPFSRNSYATYHANNRYNGYHVPPRFHDSSSAGNTCLLCCFYVTRKRSSLIAVAEAPVSMDSFSDSNSVSERIIASPMRVPPSPSRFSMSPRLDRVGSVHLNMNDAARATQNFSPSLRLGEGGFGTVYKAHLQDGQIVAIKLAKKAHYEALRSEFESEVELLATINHRNLVKLLGFVDKGDDCLIITEYVANGTLREHLDGRRGESLDFNQRLEISIDVAHGLTYLHLYA
ncbi:hypothetical protein AgCh_013368, partial [Apium graveolens]